MSVTQFNNDVHGGVFSVRRICFKLLLGACIPAFLLVACSSTPPTPTQEETIADNQPVAVTGEGDLLPDGLALLPNAGTVGIGRQLEMEIYDHLFYLSKNPSVSVQWDTSDEAIASVDDEGVVTGHATGSAQITAKMDTQDGKTYYFSSTVEVGEAVAALNVSINGDSASTDAITIPCYCSQTLHVTTLDGSTATLDQRLVTWNVAPPDAVFIESAEKIDDSFLLRPYEMPSILKKLDQQYFYYDANITGLQPGTVTVTIESEGIQKTIQVEVSENAVTSLQITPATINVAENQKRLAVAVGYTAEQCQVQNLDVVWSTEDEGIAVVDPTSGNVTGLAAGTTKLTATYQGLTVSVDVVVSKGN